MYLYICSGWRATPSLHIAPQSPTRARKYMCFTRAAMYHVQNALLSHIDYIRHLVDYNYGILTFSMTSAKYPDAVPCRSHVDFGCWGLTCMPPLRMVQTRRHARRARRGQYMIIQASNMLTAYRKFSMSCEHIDDFLTHHSSNITSSIPRTL